MIKKLNSSSQLVELKGWSRRFILLIPFIVILTLICIEIGFFSTGLLSQLLKSGGSISSNRTSYVALNKERVQPSKKRWAVFMIGGARMYAFTRQSFLRNVVNQTDPPMDIFVSTAFSNDSLFSGLSAELLDMDSKLLRFDEQYNISFADSSSRTKDRFQREQGALLQMIDDFTADQNITYDYIFYARPDTYYTTSFNISKLETLLEERTEDGNRTIFVPSCCDFGGWCDRLAAASYNDFARMIHSTAEFISLGGFSGDAYEKAFKKRGEYNNLTRTDMQRPNDYSFFTARHVHAARACAGEPDLGIYWTDAICNWGLPFELDTSVSKCKLLNMTPHFGLEGG